MKLMPKSAHAGLLSNVRASGHKYTMGVQVAAVQAIGHMLMTGDTSLATQLLQTFTDNTVGVRTFVCYMETWGGMKYTMHKKERKFLIAKEAREMLPALGDATAIEEYMADIYPVMWTSAKPERPESIYDAEVMVADLIKRLTKKQESGVEVKNAALLQHLNLAIAKFHADAFDAGHITQQ